MGGEGEWSRLEHSEVHEKESLRKVRAPKTVFFWRRGQKKYRARGESGGGGGRRGIRRLEGQNLVWFHQINNRRKKRCRGASVLGGSKSRGGILFIRGEGEEAYSI